MFLMRFLSASSVIQYICDNIVWGIPLLILIMTAGLILTIKMRGIQFKHVGESLKYMVSNETSGGGEVSSFGALCISMAATLGTGKIVGIACAIQLGGPGALFWMIVAAILGMATKYAEGFLAIRFRRQKEDGTIIGGPFCYIEDGMGKKWKWLAICFAIFGALACIMGIGTMTQMSSICDSVVSVFDPEKTNTVNIIGVSVPIASIIICAIVTILSAFAIIGGIKRISKMSSILVPVMAIGYFLVCLAVVLFNINKVPSALLTIVKEAFNFKAAFGGAAGFGILVALRQGVSKGVFSNEAGLGSAPIALASAQTDNPVNEGMVCMASTFIDTMVLCLTIGIGIVITGSYNVGENVKGIEIAVNTFSIGLHIPHLPAAIIVMLSISTFAFTTIIGWNVYGEKCMEYLTNNNKVVLYIYKVIYITTIAITPLLSLETIWNIASMFNGLMALPNLIGLIALSGLVAKETISYFKNRKNKKENELKTEAN